MRGPPPVFCWRSGTWQQGRSEQPVVFVSLLAFEAAGRWLAGERSVWGLQGSPVTLHWWLHAPLEAW